MALEVRSVGPRRISEASRYWAFTQPITLSRGGVSSLSSRACNSSSALQHGQGFPKGWIDDVQAASNIASGMKTQGRKFALGYGAMWVSIGWTLLVAAALCTLLCLADIPHMPIWR